MILMEGPRVWHIRSVYSCQPWVVEKTIEECKELVEKEQPEDKPKEEGKPTRVSRGRDVGAARSTRTRSRKTSTFDGVVLDPGSKRNRRSSARANSSRR